MGIIILNLGRSIESRMRTQIMDKEAGFYERYESTGKINKVIEHKMISFSHLVGRARLYIIVEH